ncbi:unnamed protein product [Auanema sp. JU1783]|nr:unnamed protein product [Auanema sp. JU1783]
MWSKITSHLGLWMGLDEPDRPIRTSCSLSMLHNAQLNVIRPSKSSENLHKLNINGNSTVNSMNSRRQQTQSPQQSHHTSKTSLFTLRRGRNKEKKSKNNDKLPDSMTQSWHSQANGHHHSTTAQTASKQILNFLRNRSRSNNANSNEAIVVSRTVVAPSCPNSTTVADFSHLRRRRPRSAHYEPNSISLPKEDLPTHSVSELYERIEKLGEGSYATVYKCRSKVDGPIVALKEIKLQFQEGLPFTAIREASLLRTLRHANIVCLHDIFLQHNQLTFVFEYMKMDLSKYLEAHTTGLDNFQTKLLLFQLLRGLDFCHKKKILHRDLKPQNLLLDNDGVLKLADFGLARAKSVPSRTYSNEVVTLWYRPPDVLLGNTDYTTSLDMWGVGCIFAEICSGQALFPGTRDVTDQLQRIFSVRGLPNPRRWPEVIKLPHYSYLLRMAPYWETPFTEVNGQLEKLQRPGLELLSMFLQLRPDDRLSAASAMLHPYFANLPRSVHLLPDTQSIYELPELQPLYR